MDAAMTLESRYRPLGFSGAFVRQFRLLGTSRRPLLLLVGLLAVLALAGEPWSSNELPRLLTVWPVWLMLIGPIWAFAVFHNEGPSSRLYHWSQPVSRDLHSMARVGAGLAWLWVLFAVLIVVGLVLAGLDGDAWQLGEVSVAGWANLFTGPAIGYLAVSVLTIASDYPIRWFFGILFLVGVVTSLLNEWLDWEGAVRYLVRPLADTRWGLGITMVGPIGSDVRALQLALQGAGDGAVHAGPAFDLSLWWLVTPLWMALFAAAVWFLARRHPDVLPRWRSS